MSNVVATLTSPSEGAIGRLDLITVTVLTETHNFSQVLLQVIMGGETVNVFNGDTEDDALAALYLAGGSTADFVFMPAGESTPNMWEATFVIRPAGGWLGAVDVRLYAACTAAHSDDETWSFVAPATATPPTTTIGEAPGGIGFDDPEDFVAIPFEEPEEIIPV